MAEFSTALLKSVFVVIACLLATSSCAPVTTGMTTDMITSASGPSVEALYDVVIMHAGALYSSFSTMFSSFKTERFQQDGVFSDAYDIRGFMTVANLPPLLERFTMSAAELLPKHKQFLETYKQVLRELKSEEERVVAENPAALPNTFSASYQDNVNIIVRLDAALSELMNALNIPDGDSSTFVNLAWQPFNIQTLNARSLFILQSINEYNAEAALDYTNLRERSA